MDSNLMDPLLSETQPSSLLESPDVASRTVEGTDETEARTNDDHDERSLAGKRMSNSFFVAVSVAATPMFLFGYNTGVLNAPEGVIFQGHSTLQWSLAVSGFCVGGFFGANASGGWVDTFGRRKVLLAIFWLNLLAGCMHMFTPSMNGLIIARVLIGFAGGASTVVTPMYLSEISPKEIRGTVGTMTQLSCVIGILASILWELPFDSEEKWRFIFLPIVIIAVIGIIVGHCFLLESPPWLLLNFPVERRQEAMENLRRFRHSSGDTSSDDDVVEMVPKTGVAETTLSDDTLREEEESEDLFGRHPVRLISSIFFPIAIQLSGINAVFYYSTALFEGVIPNPRIGTILAFAVNVVATLIAVFVMDRFGRKTLLSVSTGGMFACSIIMILSLKGSIPPILAVVGVMLYIIFFELGLGCIPFFLASEMIKSECLGRVQSISMTCNWFSNFCVGLLFPYMDKYLGPFSFVPFAFFLFVTFLFSLFVLPESRGKSPHEVILELDYQRRMRTPTI